MQRIEELSEDDAAELDKHREWLLGHYEREPERSYAGYTAKLALIDVILRSKWILPGETWKLQSLGVAFGDALAEYLGLHWVAVEDEFGRDPALRDGDSSLKLFPLTAISKRVERGEEPSAVDLFRSAVRSVEDVRMKLNGN